MDTNGKTTIIVGLMFIIATVAGVISALAFGSLLTPPVDLARVARERLPFARGYTRD